MKAKKLVEKKTTPSYKALLAKGVPAVLIPGLVVAFFLGWKYSPLTQDKTNFYHIKQVFPDSGVVVSVEDGDTLVVHNGIKVRLLGVDAANRGTSGYEKAKEALTDYTLNKKVYLEYDRYQDDKYGRILAWVWVDCEKVPTFLPPKYMHENGNTSKPGLWENPQGCKQGILVNESLIASKTASLVVYQDRGPLKYQERIMHKIKE